MTRRPVKPHKDGYEDEEDCCGHYDPWEEERRNCHEGGCSKSDLPINDTYPFTGRACYQKWRAEEDAEHKARWDAKTPGEKAAHEEFVKGLRELY